MPTHPESSNPNEPAGGIRSGISPAEIQASFLDSLFCDAGRTLRMATRHDRYAGLAMAVRDRVLKRAAATLERHSLNDCRAVGYLSAEYLPGPHLANNLLNLCIEEQTAEAMKGLGLSLDDLVAEEEEPGLGNGGLGRLASCYLDSMATLGIPAIGYGIRYEFGIFDQVIQDGWQAEVTDKWLRAGNRWEIPRSELYFDVRFGGRTEDWEDEHGNFRVRWIPEELVRGMAYDTPILGYKGETCNTMRLWRAQAVESFDLQAFNHGDYYRAVESKMASENITKILYPNDETAGGKRLRLKQQYFFVACSLQDMVRIHLALGRPLDRFHEKWVIQLNDTHPSIAVAELMRLLVDDHGFDWDAAWKVTSRTIAYTNHTLLPEALERWSVSLMRSLLPRHLEIIYEINRRFLEEVRARFPGDEERVARMSLIDESGERYVRMAHLAVVASRKVNGVAKLHSDLLKASVLRDFADLWPDRFCNVTNGVTPRRFLALGNPELVKLIRTRISNVWVRHLERLRELEPAAEDPAFRANWRKAQHFAKERLARLVLERTGIAVDPTSLFDVQVKRIHEYKRQHLNVLHILALYLRVKQNPSFNIAPRTFLFGGKAAPGYFMAKLIIKLVNSVGALVNQDPDVNGRLKVAFIPDFNVKTAQWIYPAADLSEQISTAGKEASGTGNMKFSMNGALTIGTLDGANVEIREEVGPENFFLFGKTVEELDALRQTGYKPGTYYDRVPELRAVLDLLGDPRLGGGDPRLFRPLLDDLLWHDPFFVLADFESYLAAQEQVSALWQDPEEWTRRSILNTARMGKFSSDRSIRDYCERIWDIQPGSTF